MWTALKSDGVVKLGGTSGDAGGAGVIVPSIASGAYRARHTLTRPKQDTAHNSPILSRLPLHKLRPCAPFGPSTPAYGL